MLVANSRPHFNIHIRLQSCRCEKLTKAMMAISDQADPAYVALLGFAESFRQVNNINECVRCLKVNKFCPTR